MIRINFGAEFAVDLNGGSPALVNNTVSSNDGSGVGAGPGNPGDSPLLEDPLLAADGIHITLESPARNAGDGTFVAEGDLDIDGRPRPPVVDIGADEFLCVGQANVDCNGNGIPDECERLADLNGDGMIRTIDLLLLLSLWGPVPPGHPYDPGDIHVGTTDLLMLLADWGPCR